MAVPAIIAGTILLVDRIGGKIISDKKKIEAKKIGAELAAHTFIPLIDTTKEATRFLKSVVQATNKELESILVTLETELLNLEDTYDDLSEVLRLKQQISLDGNVQQLSCSKDWDGSRESTDKYFMALSTRMGFPDFQDITDSFDKMKIIFTEPYEGKAKVGIKKFCMTGVISSTVLAMCNDYEEEKMEQFNKECIVWSKRLNEERKLFSAELDKYKELIESGESERIYYQCKIFERMNQIGNMKMLINMYGEL